MAGLFASDTSHNRSSLQPMLIGALALALLLGAGLLLYLRHEDHPAVEVTGLRSLTVPLHTVYTHTGHVVGTDMGEDSTYVLAAVRVRDRASVPLFLKDITAGLVLADGSLVEATRIKAKDMDRVAQLVPALRPAMQQIALPALQPEQTVAPGASDEGYVLLQINGPESLWKTRRQATLTLDFYHQESVTATLQ